MKFSEPQYGHTFLRDIDDDLNTDTHNIIANSSVPAAGKIKYKNIDNRSNPSSIQNEPTDFVLGLSKLLLQRTHLYFPCVNDSFLHTGVVMSSVIVNSFLF